MTGARANLRVVVGLFSLELGGSQLNTVDLACELRRRGHQMTLFVVDEPRRHDPSIMPVAESKDFPIEILPREATIRAQASHLARLADDRHADIVHVYHEAGSLGPVAAVALRSRRCTSLVVTNWMMANTHWMPHHASLIVGYPALAREAAARHKGPVSVLEPPVNVQHESVSATAAAAFRSRIGATSDDLLITLVTRVDHFMKLDGILLALRAITLVGDERFRLVIVGDGRAMDLVRHEASLVNERLGRHAVALTGAMADPRPAYGAADIVLGMGGSALRGLAFAKAVIVLGEGSFSLPFGEDTAAHFYDNGLYGRAADAESGSRLAEQLTMLADERVRRALGVFGAHAVSTRYSLEMLSSRLEDIYQHALVNKARPHERWTDSAYILALDQYHKRIPGGIRRTARRLAASVR